MTERTTVRLPPDLVRRAKHKAAEQGRSLTALIEEGLRRVVDDTRATQPSARILPRARRAVSCPASTIPPCRRRMISNMPGGSFDPSAALLRTTPAHALEDWRLLEQSGQSPTPLTRPLPAKGRGEERSAAFHARSRCYGTRNSRTPGKSTTIFRCEGRAHRPVLGPPGREGWKRGEL